MLPVAEAVEPVADLVMAAEGRVEAEREAVGDSVGVDSVEAVWAAAGLVAMAVGATVALAMAVGATVALVVA